MSLMNVLHALWQGAVLAGMVWVLMRLRGGWSAESRYWLWSATLVVIAVLPLLALLPRVELATPVSFPTVSTSVATANVTKLVESVPSMRSSVLLSTAQQVWQLIPALWFAIVCWRLLLLAKAAHTLRRWRNTAQRVPAEALPLPRDAFRGCDVRESTDITTPAVVGILDPCILLPQGLRARLQRQQLALVLRHELAHVQRRDGWHTLVQRLIEAVCFYNPVVHWVSAMIEREREASCDDRAIRATNESGLLYAECLVNVSREVAVRQVPALAVGAVGNPTQLTRRVRRLLDRSEAEDTRGSWPGVAAGVSLLVCAALALSLVVPHAEARDEPRGADRTPLIKAARSGDGTPLMEAARRGDLPLVKLLLDRGADVNEAVLRDGNPLIIAAARGHLEVVMTLVDRGADVNAFVPEDETPLINATRGGHLQVAAYLIDKGADVNLAVLANGKEMRSPLGEALKHSHQDVAEMLLKRGAKP